jgi:hypothetical protein
METGTNIVLRLMDHRADEIKTWIKVRTQVWYGLLALGVVAYIKAVDTGNIAYWVLLGVIAIVWVGFEGSCGYYLHLSGSQARRLEEKLPDPSLGHEQRRALIAAMENAAKAATLGFAQPFVLMLVVACSMMLTKYWDQGGHAWIIVLAVGAVFTAGYYIWVVRSAKQE